MRKHKKNTGGIPCASPATIPFTGPSIISAGTGISLPPLPRAPAKRSSFECLDSSGGQLGADATLETLANLDFGKINPCPVRSMSRGQSGRRLEGDDPQVPSVRPWLDGEYSGLRAAGRPVQGSGPACRSYDTGSMAPAAFGPGGKVPLKPFTGTIGVAPAEAGLHSVVPPRRVGGNLDIRDLTAGVTLYLPIEVEALSSRWATPMPPRATAKSAAPPSKAR